MFPMPFFVSYEDNSSVNQSGQGRKEEKFPPKLL
jgi:hypothetical protein